MPDAIQPVGAMIQPPDPSKGLGMMSSILGIQQQRQNLQTGQYQQATAQADSQQAQQKNAEMQALATFTQNATKDPSYQLPDGSPDVGKYQKGAMAVAPTYGQPYIGQMSSNFKEAVDTRRSVQALSADQNAQLGGALQGLAGNPNSTRTDLMNVIEQQRANNKDPGYNRALDNMLLSIDKNDVPGSAAKAAAALKGMSPQQGQSAAGQNQLINPLTGARSMPALSGGAANPTSPTVAAQTAQALIPPKNQQGMSENDVTRYAQIGQEGTNAQTGVQLAHQVSQLADQVRTGQLSKEWADRLAVLKQNDPNITNRQMLSKYAAQLKTMATQGATTDASRQQIDDGMPSPESMDPQAVKQAAQYVGGIFGMRGARQSVADQYVKRNGNAIGIQGVDNEFMRAADPTLFAYKSLPSGSERQAFLKAHNLTTPEAQQEFKARMNQVNHYSGGQ